MRNLKFGAKIAIGFGVLIVIALLLGAMSVYNMKDTQRQSNRMAKAYVPEVAVANEMERAYPGHHTGDACLCLHRRGRLLQDRLGASGQLAGLAPPGGWQEARRDRQ